MDLMGLKKKSLQIRENIVTLIHKSGCGHIGGDLSVTDILVALYYSKMNCSPERIDHPSRDRFILSKGHSVEALYCILADKGYFTTEELFDTYSCYLSRFIGHPNNKIPGVEMNSGSLGHGLSVSVGMALAARMDGASYRIYTVMGDGELAEGSVWEAAMAGGHFKLDNLTAFIDRNRLQISGCTENIMAQEDLEKRWSAFGWNILSIPGNDIEKICGAIDTAKATKGKPTLIIANTTKGYGVSFMENKAEWHHRVPTDKEYHTAMEELEEKRRAAS